MPGCHICDKVADAVRLTPRKQLDYLLTTPCTGRSTTSHPPDQQQPSTDDEGTPIATDPAAVAATPLMTLRRALACVSLARRLARVGWHQHQHAEMVVRTEKGSEPVPQPLDPECATVAARLQATINELHATPPPALRLPSAPAWPTDPDGSVRLQWLSDERPAERSLTDTSTLPVEDGATIWRNVVAELASQWADSTTPGRSAGRVFVGPKDRMIFWPRALNALLRHLTTSHGRIWDLFAILAKCGIKIDLKSAYRSVTICAEDAVYHAALVDGVWIIFRRLSFGMAQSPAAFEALLDVTIRRYRGCIPATLAALSQYVDDSGVSAVTPLQALLAGERLVQALRDDGWWLSIAKAFLLPAARLLFTGFIADFPGRRVYLHRPKIEKAMAVMRRVTRPDLWRDLVPRMDGSAGWFSKDRALPDHILALPHCQPLPDPGTLTAPDAVGTREVLTCQELHAITVVVGYLCWFQVVLNYLGPWRLSLSQLAREGRWTPSHLATFDQMYALLSLAHDWPRHVDSRGAVLIVIVDGSASGWGARLSCPERGLVYLSGLFDDDDIGQSSTFREVVAGTRAVRAAFRLGLVFGAVRILTDSTCFTFCVDGRPKAPAVAAALLDLTAWQAQGLQISIEWHSRASELAKVADGLSGASRPRPWPLRPCILSWLWDFVGGWDLHLATSDELATVPAYATADADWVPSHDRRAVIDGLCQEVASRPASGDPVGWQGTVSSVRLHGVAFAQPLFSELGQIATRWTSDPTKPLVLVAPLEGADFWAPHLASLKSIAHHTIPLQDPASIPPRPGTPRDPRPLALYLIGLDPASPSDTSTSRRGRPRWWSPWMLTADGDVESEPGPSPRSPRSRRAAADDIFGPAHAPPRRSPPPPPPLVRPPGRGRASPAPPPPTTQPSPPVLLRAVTATHPTPDAAAGARAAADAIFSSCAPRDRPPTSATATRAIEPPPALPRPCASSVRPRPVKASAHAAAAPPSPRAARAAADDIFSAGPQRPPPATHHRATAGATAAPALASTAPLPTAAGPHGSHSVGSVLRHALLVHGGRSASAPDPRVASAHAAALAKADALVVTKALQGSGTTVVSLLRLLSGFAAHRGVSAHPWSDAECEALVLDFSLSRLPGEPSIDIEGWTSARPSAALGHASRLAAGLRRAGFPTPPHCGPRVKDTLIARGALEKPEHSAAYPLHLGLILRAEPAKADANWDCWGALVILVAFALRSGIIFHVWSDMFVPYGGGFIFVWRHPHKRTAAISDVMDLEALSKIGSITGARHPVLARIIERQRPNHRLFPQLTAERVSTFVRRCVPGAPPGFDIRTYGTRTSAAHDAMALHLAEPIAQRIFWWKPPANTQMRVYYSSQAIEESFVFTERRASLVFTHILPGTCDVRVRTVAHRDWTSVGVGGTLPAPPNVAHLRAALACSAPSVGLQRSIRASIAAKRARQAAGDPSTSSASSGSGKAPVHSGPCTECAEHIDTEDEAAACTRCIRIACQSCHADLTSDYLCPVHRPRRRRVAARPARK